MTLMPHTETEPDLQLTVHAPQLEEEDGPDLIDHLTVLGNHKGIIVKFTLLASAIALIIAFLLPKIYEATTKIMPPQQSPSAATALIGQLGPLAALAGSSLGVHNPSDLYVDMLRSRTVADDLIQRFSLIQVYHDKDIVEAREDLDKMSEISAAKDGVISITVGDHDPQRATDIANAYVEELQKLSQTLAVTEAGRRRLFFEREVQKAAVDLGQAEVALKDTQRKTGIIHLDSQAKAMIESLTYLQAQLTGKEAEVESMRSFATPENPEFVRAKQQVESLRQELAKVQSGQGAVALADISTRSMPEAGLEYIRKLRDVRYHESLWEALTKQYEIARIDEAKDASLIQPLDKAVRPLKKARPHRSWIILLTAFCATFVVCVFVLISESVERARKYPDQAARLDRLKSSFFGRRVFWKKVAPHP